MVDRKPEILKEIDEHRHELCLYLMDLYELIGFHEDDMDYYYEVIDIRGQTQHLSCVGGFLYLKEKLSDKEYEGLELLWKLNVRDKKALRDKMVEAGHTSISYKKGQKFWIELEAKSDGDLRLNNPILANLIFRKGEIENFSIPNFILDMNSFVNRELIANLDAVLKKYQEL